MEFPPFDNNRYVPHRPLPPDHHYHRDIHHLPPPPPFHPPPPPSLYPPPPPPFNPHHPNFTFPSPEFDNSYPPPRPSSWTDPPRVSPYNSRPSFRDEFVDPYRGNPSQAHSQSHRFLHDRYDDDIRISNSYRYNSCFRRESRENSRLFNENRDENRRRGPKEMENNGEFVSSRRERKVYDSGRFSNRVPEERDDRKESNHTPKRKSVLFRIGKPNNDSRNNRSHRGKEKEKDAKKEREGSPVDLDVRFKSNALVAKATSSPAKSVTPRSSKFRKATLSGSPQTKSVEHSVKSDGADCPSSSEKTPEKADDVTASVNGIEVNDSAGSGATGDKISDEGHKRVGSGESPSYVIRKRKKVGSPYSLESNLKSTEKESEPISVDSSMNTPTATDQVDEAVSVCSPNGPTTNKVDGSPQDIVLEMDNTEINSGRSLLLDSENDNSTNFLDSMCPQETEFDKGNEIVRGSVYTSVSDFDKIITEFEDRPSVSSLGSVDDDLSRRACLNGKSLLLVNGIVKGENGNADLSNPEDDKVHEGDRDSNMAVHDACNASDSNFRLKREENITVSNIDFMDAVPEQSSLNEATNLLDNCIEESYLNAADNSGGALGDLELSKAVETKINEGHMNDPSSPTSSDSGFNCHQRKETISSTCLEDDTSTQLCLDGPAMICRNTLTRECRKVEISRRDCLESETCPGLDYSTKVNRKRKVGDLELDLSSPMTPVNVVSSVLDEDTLLSCSVEDLVPAEEKDDRCGVGPLVNGDPNGPPLMDLKKRKVFAPDEKIGPEGGSSLPPKVNVKLGQPTVNDLSINMKSASSPSQDAHKTIQSLNPIKGNLNLTRKQPTSAFPRVFTGPSLPFNTSKKATPANHNAKSRTWVRIDSPVAAVPVKKTSFTNPVPMQRLSTEKTVKVQGSYVRKGNSLVRKPGSDSAVPHGSQALSSSACPLNPPARDDVIKKSSVPQIRVDDASGSSSLSTKWVRDEIKKSSGSESMLVIDSSASSAPSERPKAPPLPQITKSLNCTTIHADFTPSALASTPSDSCSETTSNEDIPKISEDGSQCSGTSECQIGLNNDVGSQRVLDEGNSGKKIMYVKPKSYQLIATSNSDVISGQDVGKASAVSSDSYYKRRKNQLVRASGQSHNVPGVVLADNTLSAEGQRVSKAIASRSSSKRKALAKTYKPSKLSFVWRLSNNDTQSSTKDGNSLRCQKERSHLFQWKRATYWQSPTHNPAYIYNNNSLSLISRKLLVSRKRDTIYSRSRRGFSLRISKLLSVGGSSLKWSKSIEKNSKRANEEATLAVAAAQKKKREQNPCGVSRTKSRNQFSRKLVYSKKLHPGERIFRIGSVRYKMDPTRRTLQRISDEEEPSCAAPLESKENVKKSYVPRRLLIGNDEYVRIGNGNQLVRDPKKRTRTLASEKVRWSLHTARLRLARKSKYCQFFTRFGKCNKDDGKCPYIHDRSKIAVCTKFLNGSCSNPNCELTHKVIPERMQDCSYYQQGLCSHDNCPYRHVNVNANARVCESFLKGYCADGDECRKKHTYVCPKFEATGICPEGSKCKLHHPNKRSKGTKQKLREQKNARGRYFGTDRHIIEDAGGSRAAVVLEKLYSKDDADDIFSQGKLADYISIDISDDEVGEIVGLPSEKITIFDSNPVLQGADVDVLTKPVRVMSNIPALGFSPAVDSLRGRSASYISEESNCCK